MLILIEGKIMIWFIVFLRWLSRNRGTSLARTNSEHALLAQHALLRECQIFTLVGVLKIVKDLMRLLGIKNQSCVDQVDRMLFKSLN